MKLISLNIWGGTVFEPLINFVKEQSKDTDIFCFQEVFSSFEQIKTHKARANIYQELEKDLPDFKGYFSPLLKNHDFISSVNFNLEFGTAVFIKKTLNVTDNNSTIIYRKRFDKVDKRFNFPLALQNISLEGKGKVFNIFNYHGKWSPGSKLDTPLRISFSHKIKKIINQKNTPKILCGDFNLMLETKSIAILETGMKNLIREYKIKDTRGEVNRERHKTVQYFADYMFISSEVKVLDFKVPFVAISDHLPLVLEFN